MSGSTGWENGTLIAKNMTFDYTATPPRAGGFTANGQLFIGSVADPDIVAVPGFITAGPGSGPGIAITNGPGTIRSAMSTPYSNGDFEFRSEISGETRVLSVTNINNTANSQSQFTHSVAGTSAGDTWSQWTVGSSRSYAIGIDNSASQTLKMTTAASASVNPSTATPVWTLTPTSGFNYDNSGTNSFGIGFNTSPITNYSVRLSKSTLNDFYGIQVSNSNAGNASLSGIDFISDTAECTVSVASSGHATAAVRNKLFLNATTGSTGILLNSNNGAVYFYDNVSGGIQAAQLDATNGMQVNLVQALTSNGNLTVKGNGAGHVALTTGATFGAGTDIMNNYVEGTWTPTLTGSTTGPDTITYSSQVGQYTRIGRQVFFTGTVAVATFTLGAGAGNLTLSGLPITVNATLGGICTVTLEGVDFATTNYIVGQIVPSTVTLRFLEVNDNAAATFVPLSGLAAGDTVRVSGFYNA